VPVDRTLGTLLPCVTAGNEAPLRFVTVGFKTLGAVPETVRCQLRTQISVVASPPISWIVMV